MTMISERFEPDDHMATGKRQGGLPGRLPGISRILLRSSWQTINIGDIGHTPGVLALIEKYLPDTEVRLWPGDVGRGVREMLMARFPRLNILDTEHQIGQALSECDFLLHGSGPYLVAPNVIERWQKETGKPYGVYGITLPPRLAGDREVRLLSEARFVYFRDSTSLNVARDKGVTAPVMAFGPDGAFAVDLRNEIRAEAFLAKHALDEGRFLCCIPRYRYCPAWKLPSKRKPVDVETEAFNEQWKEHDHLPLREAIIRVVYETSMKVLICAEDETQMALGKEVIFDKLPEDVKPRVIWRPDFWLPDEAISVYVRSAGLFGHEMHSPIMCIGNGIPAIVCRWESQTSKGLMWRDIGLDDWLFDVDNENDMQRLPEAVLEMATNPASARNKAARAKAFVEAQQRETMKQLRSELASVQSTLDVSREMCE